MVSGDYWVAPRAQPAGRSPTHAYGGHVAYSMQPVTWHMGMAMHH